MATEFGAEELVANLRAVFLELNNHAYPDVECPPGVPKRASVALIVRIQPSYSHWPNDHLLKESSFAPTPSRLSQHQNTSATKSPTIKHEFEVTLDAFFQQEWVKYGDPEVLFIKRASRVGDKWTGHVALPGGKRDPEDSDDAAAAVRETWEEVGIDLGPDNAIAIGNLPQRVVTTSWGKVPLMVLCPYIYLLTSPSYPAQCLQPTEVASSHWVSVRSLLSPALRTHEYADVSARLSKSELGVKRWFLQAMLSKMVFAAIHLIPSNSTHCASIPGFVPISTGTMSVASRIKVMFGSHSVAEKPPLLLWGLTLGVVSDFLEHIPPHNALELWTYPTFTTWDVRLVMWILSYRFRRRKNAELTSRISHACSTTTKIDDEGASTPVQDLPGAGSEAVGGLGGEKPGEVGIAGLGVGRGWGQIGRAQLAGRGAAVNSMLEGYYPIIRQAVAAAIIGRIGVATLVAVWAWRNLVRSRG